MNNPEPNIVEPNFTRGSKKDHTHVRFYISRNTTIIGKQMFIEHFPELQNSSSRQYLIKVKETEL